MDGPSVGAPGPGIWLVGQLLSIKPGKEWTGKDGQLRSPFLATILVGEAVFRVEYLNEDSARLQVAAGSAGYTDGTTALRVYPRANKDRVFYGGQSVRPTAAAVA